MSFIKWIRKFGVNFKTVHCPECGTEQPRVRKPQDREEFLWGGSTCQKCGCKMDKYGEKRK